MKKASHLFVKLVEKNPLMYNNKDFRIKTKTSYSFVDCGTDRQTESISESALKDIWMIYDTPIKAEN